MAHTNTPLLRIASKVSVELLELDRKNPRLVESSGGKSDESIIANLYSTEELEELLQSIASNGYLDIEPLIVISEGQGDRLTVLEGNRRLAALKLFREPHLATSVAERTGIRISMPQMEVRHAESLETVTVYRVETREEARPFIGFKHINGAARWDSYAKAKFAAEWYRDENVTLEEISERIGDKHATIKKMVTAIYVLDQAANEGVFEIEDRSVPRFNFSHLYTALSRKQYMDYLGLDISWARFEPSVNPVSHDKIGRLGQVLTWIYGSKKDGLKPVVRSQNPDIKRLGEVICNAEGLHVLKASNDLNEAFDSTRPSDTKFSDALVEARKSVNVAVKNIRGYDGFDRSLYEVALDVQAQADLICGGMLKRIKIAEAEEISGKD